jgi:putative oxygen-independent coproporphyrinogen III oxidase
MQTRFDSVYVHFPFCETKCHYCDFYSIGAKKTAQSDPARFEVALLRETQLMGPKLAPALSTIFFGGGTPSMTPPETMWRWREEVSKFSAFSPDLEWTMEANPSSIEPKKMTEYRSLGINRVSMGVQSLNDELLLLLGRVHSRAKALEALTHLFEAGFSNVSVDLICGVPGQTVETLLDNLKTLLTFPITHLSCYLLTLPKHHPLARQMPPEDTQLEHLLRVDEMMTLAGFEHYEVSNYCRPDLKAQHNLRYWSGSSYLGIGPSAHSYDSALGTRWKNVSSLHRYAEELEADRLPIEWTENLTPDQRKLEAWMLAVRTTDGYPDSWLISPQQRSRHEDFVQKGWVEKHPSQPLRWRLTSRGYPLSDPILTSLAL